MSSPYPAFSFLTKKTFLLVSLAMLMFTVAYADNDATTLLQKIKNSTQDTATVKLMNQLSLVYTNQPKFNDSTFLWSDNAIALCKKLNDKNSLAQSYYLKGIAYLRISESSKALQSFYNAIASFKEADNTRGIAKTYMQIGLVMYTQKVYAEALTNFDEGLKYFADIKDSSHIATIYYLKGLSNNETGKLDEGVNQIEKSLAIRESLHEAKGIYECKLFLANSYVKQKRLPTAVFYYNECTAYFKKEDNTEGIILANLGLGKAYRAMDENSTALKYFKLIADSLISKTSSDWVIIQVDEELADFYSSQKQYDKAYTYLSSYYKLNDSIFNFQNTQTINSLKSKFDLEKKEAEIKILNQQQQTNKYLMFGLGLLSLLLILLVWLWYNRFKYKKEANLLLEEKNVELEKTLTELKDTEQQIILSEKMTSLGRLTNGIAHEIMNPLNFVNNFSELSLSLITDLAETKNETERQELAQEINHSLAKINQHGKRAERIIRSMMLHAQSSSGEMAETDVNLMLDEALELSFNSFHSMLQGFNCVIEKNYDLQLPPIMVKKQDIARVLLNIINNSFFAIYEKQNRIGDNFKPLLIINTKLSNYWVEIAVRDNGVGIPDEIREKIFEPFFTTKAPGEGTGLGLSLSYDIIKSYGGSIAVSHVANEGAEFIISIPVIHLKK